MLWADLLCLGLLLTPRRRISSLLEPGCGDAALLAADQAPTCSCGAGTAALRLPPSLGRGRGVCRPVALGWESGGALHATAKPGQGDTEK